MSAPQVVATVTAAVVAVSIAVVAVGVGYVAGFGWALICSGSLTGLCSAIGCYALLRDRPE